MTSKSTMKVLHVTPSFAPAFEYGGSIPAVLHLCQAVRQAGVDVRVATTTANLRRELDVEPDSWTEYDGVPVCYFKRGPRSDFAPSVSLWKYLQRHIVEYDLVHITSTFSFPASIAGAFARTRAIPYIVSPHGSLQSWSLSQKRWKKIPYWALLERHHLTGAAAIHVTADVEENEARRVLPFARFALVPNGVEEVSERTVERVSRRIAFLGRVHKKKGFDVLVPALVQVAREMPDVETLIAGPDDGEWARVAEAVDKSSPRPRVRYIGPLRGEERLDFLASASAFVLPSHSENFGIAVLEAMACGTPVVVSRNCPWSSVEDVGAGAWVENTPEQVSAALLRILRDENVARIMGAAGKSLAREYSWPAIGKQMAELYASLAPARVASVGGRGT